MQSTVPTLAPKKATTTTTPVATTKSAAPVAAATKKPITADKHVTSADVSAMYQKVSPIEHVLLRPEMYIGSIENHKVEHAWLFKPDATRELYPRLLPAGPVFDAAYHAVNGSLIDRVTGGEGGGGGGEEATGEEEAKKPKVELDEDVDAEEEITKDDVSKAEDIKPAKAAKGGVSDKALANEDVIVDTTGEFDEVDGTVKGVDVRLVDPKNRIERIFGPGTLYQTSVCENPGLMKIVDEILVNAADNRLQSKKTNPQTYIRVTVDDKTGRVTISNDGRGIPIVMHPEHQAYVPDLIFGHLLTSSHYSNDPNSTAAGRHGYGAKLTNIMSTNFSVECISEGKRFVGKWTNNMQDKVIDIIDNYNAATTPDSGVLNDEETLEIQKISQEDAPHSRTTISFIPDFDRFMAHDKTLLEEQKTMKAEFDALVSQTEGKSDISDEKKDRLRYLSGALAEMKLPIGFNIKNTMRDLIKKRCLDLAASIVGSGVNVFFNNELISPDSLAAYGRMHFAPTNIETQPYILENKKEGFTLCVSFTRPPVAAGAMGSATGANPNAASNRISIALVNSLVTPQGGTHLNHAQRAVETAIGHVSALIRKTIGLSLSDSLIRNNCQVVVSCNVKQPKFDSQSKQKLVSRHSFPHINTKGLEAYMLSVPFLSEFCSVNNAADLRKINMELKRLQDGKHMIDKLVEPPRNSAITYRTLILTEGDSAKSLALNSLTTLQRESFGVYPLRGKVLNVRTNHIAKLMKNKELLNVLAALGLELKGEYSSLSKLRYQRVIIMTDQDHDGTHIRGLLLNFFHYLWPQLLRDHPNFITIFSTPLVKVKVPAKLLDNPKELQMNFYNEKKFDDWRADIPAWKMQKIFVRYYKGLGTSTSKEGREYFESIEERLSAIDFNQDSSVDDGVLDEMFGCNASARRARIDKSRNEALESGENFTIAEQKNVTVPDFAAKELVQYANYDNKRSIPNFVDGLKVSQRKVLWAMMTRNTSAMRVSQIAGYVSEMSHYHHGESSLIGSIIVMARDYVTSNNVPLLSPEGQFGSRSMEGHDHAAARYIFSKLAKVTRCIFPKEDDEHLTYINSDGDRVEPEFYAPVIPFALVNGTRSIGFGYMNSILPRDPVKILQATRKVVEGTDIPTAFDTESLVPHYSGFLGTTKRDAATGEVYTFGVVELLATKSSLSTFNDIDMTKVKLRSLPEYDADGMLKQFECGPDLVRDIVIVRVTELPIGEVASSYRDLIHSKFGDMIISYADYSGADHVDIEMTIKTSPLYNRIKSSREESFLIALGLRRRVGTDVLSGFDSKGRLFRSGQIVNFLGDYFDVRLKTYVRRLEALRAKCKFDIQRTNSIITFSNMVREDKNVFKLTEEALHKKLASAKLLKIEDSYNYLTNRSVTSLLDTNHDSMTKRLANLKAEEINLRTKVTPQTLWKGDLDELEKHLVSIEQRRVDSIRKALAPRTATLSRVSLNTLIRARPNFNKFVERYATSFPELENDPKAPLKAHSLVMYTMKQRGWTPQLQWKGVMRMNLKLERMKKTQRVLQRKLRHRKQLAAQRAAAIEARALEAARRAEVRETLRELREKRRLKVASKTAAAALPPTTPTKKLEAAPAKSAKKSASTPKPASPTGKPPAAAVGNNKQAGRATAATKRRPTVAKMDISNAFVVGTPAPVIVSTLASPLMAVTTFGVVDRIALMRGATLGGGAAGAVKKQATQFTATGLMNFARRFIF